MKKETRELLEHVQSQANECYDFARKHDDDFGNWDNMTAMIAELTYLIQDLKWSMGIGVNEERQETPQRPI